MTYNFTYQRSQNNVLVTVDTNAYSTTISVSTPVIVVNSMIHIALDDVTFLNFSVSEVGLVNSQPLSFYGVNDIASLASLLRSVCFNSTFNAYVYSTQPWIIVSGSYNASIYDFTIVADTSSGAFDVRIPSASLCSGKLMNVKRSGSLINACNIVASGLDLIDNSSSKILSAPLDNVSLQSLGNKWIIL